MAAAWGFGAMLAVGRSATQSGVVVQRIGPLNARGIRNRQPHGRFRPSLPREPPTASLLPLLDGKGSSPVEAGCTALTTQSLPLDPLTAPIVV